MSRLILTASILAFALAMPASAQQSPAQRSQDPLQKMYDAPLRKMYDDPLKKMYDDPMRRLYGDKPSIYAPNPLAPGANQAPRTMNEAPAGQATPYLPPGAVSGGNPGSGDQPAFDNRFRRFDRNNDGYVTRDEYVTSNMLRAPVNPSTADLQRDSLRRRFDSRFRGADANRNGSISRDEYDAVGNPRF